MTITLPGDLLKSLRGRTRNLSAYLAEAARERLERELYVEGLRRGFGAWKEDLHPHLRSEEDIVEYVNRTRESWRPREMQW